MGDKTPELSDEEDAAIREELAMNPALKQGKKTVDVVSEIAKLQGARALRQMKKDQATAAGQTKPTKDLAAVIADIERKHDAEKADLKSAAAVVADKTSTLPSRIHERIIDVIVALDPNMQSP